MIGAIQLVLLTLVFFAMLACVACSVGTPWFLRFVARLSPRTAVRVLLGYVAAPVVVAVAFTAACFGPWVLSLFRPSVDHCLHHTGHPHLCFTHLPETPGSGSAWLLLSVAGLYAGMKIAGGVRALIRADLLMQGLRSAATPGTRLGTWEVQSGRPFCLTAGLFRPKVMLSRGLLERLAKPEIDAAVAHERAHVRRRDALTLALARALGIFHLPHVRVQLIERLELACEMACDEEAAAVVGDRLVVADAIVSVKRLLQGDPTLGAIGIAHFGHGSLETRVRALLDEPVRVRGPRVFLMLSVLALAVLVFADPLHHATETVLSALTH